MPIVKAKPTSPGRRGLVKVVHTNLHKGKPHRALVETLAKTGGRNNMGRITVRHIGGGAPRNIELSIGSEPKTILKVLSKELNMIQTEQH